MELNNGAGSLPALLDECGCSHICCRRHNTFLDFARVACRYCPRSLSEGGAGRALEEGLPIAGGRRVARNPPREAEGHRIAGQMGQMRHRLASREPPGQMGESAGHHIAGPQVPRTPSQGVPRTPWKEMRSLAKIATAGPELKTIFLASYLTLCKPNSKTLRYPGTEPQAPLPSRCAQWLESGAQLLRFRSLNSFLKPSLPSASIRKGSISVGKQSLSLVNRSGSRCFSKVLTN